MNKKELKTISKNLNSEGFKFITDLLNNYEVQEYYRLADIKLTEELSQVAHDISHINRCLVIANKLIDLCKKLGLKYEQVEKKLCNDQEVNMCIFVAVILHDIGNAINRNLHHEISVWLTISICREPLKAMFPKKYPLFLSMISSEILRHQFTSELVPKDLASAIMTLSDKLDISQERTANHKASDFINVVTSEILEAKIYAKKGQIQIDVMMKNPNALFRVERLKGFIDKLPTKLQKIFNVNVYLVKYRKKVKWI
jgi:metal-dependent HD superfamily phosphatase/phosphodiesterase